ncbi:PEP-CTERM/exosortase system-associated acyltransferase [Geobacter hydrogenophilus]|uniref:PEP-CTERM/exosortase system-associated acyltransferase n=1 Tax=Geobacter hydrogenophilus TaxID=40983 RepID=A0A9W6LCV0_9BACT|nr:PEP-CTERM/exosortase system-associated acyltransferase [Geobacter hydrogenophilus]MBT0895756.1 PEP-CTERM/exosortase system-associated acyltransferase [Geobacter hydrogenophilus]GLI39267.1 hypothetical protein GHYDROH2_27680 [Geobacter hydrogenophilus]
MIPFHFSQISKGDKQYSSYMEEIFRIRFKVYCEEWGFEDPTAYPDGMERNEFDEKSEHFVIQSTHDNSIIGTARVIFPSELGYAVTKNCLIDPMLHGQLLSGWKEARIGEVSRLAISKEYRKRIEDNVLSGLSSDLPDVNSHEHEKRKCNYVHEFYKYLLFQSMELGLTHWYVAMKRGLYILLKRVGMVFHPIGPEIEYHGLRTPYLGSLREIREGMLQKDPNCFDFIKDLTK